MTEAEFEDLHNRLQSLKDLQKSPGWIELEGVLLSQIEARKTRELAFDITSGADLYELTKLKAERRAMQLVLDLPQTMVENLTEDVKEEEDAAE